MPDGIRALRLGPGSLVVEIASNDGYLLQHFVKAGVPVLGIEPARTWRKVALAKGIPTRPSSSERRRAKMSLDRRSHGQAPTCSSATTSWPRCRT
jgi:hypothetical protein